VVAPNDGFSLLSHFEKTVQKEITFPANLTAFKPSLA